MVAYPAAEVEAEDRRVDGSTSVAVYLRQLVVGELGVAPVAGSGGGAPAARPETGDSAGCGEGAQHRRVAL